MESLPSEKGTIFAEFHAKLPIVEISVQKKKNQITHGND